MNPEKTLFLPDPNPYSRTINFVTNPDIIPRFVRPRESLDPIMRAIRLYLLSVLIGDGESPHCPFVNSIERGNGYYVDFHRESPDFLLRTGMFEIIVRLLEKEFKRLSPSQTHEGQPMDITSLMAAFTAPSAAQDKHFCRKLSGVQRYYRPQFLKKGLMLSEMHAFHPRTRHGDTGYSSQIPLLIVRRMHAQDHVFMRTEGERNIFKRFFPGQTFVSE